MTTLAERFANAATLAHMLTPPATIIARICADPVDTGLRAANLDGKIRGGDHASHPERMAERRKPDVSRLRDDAIDVRRAADTAVNAIAQLLARGRHIHVDPTSYTWADATKDAHLLAELGIVDTLLDLDHDRSTRRIVISYLEAIASISQISRRWPKHTGRAPTDIEAAYTDDLADEDCCRICLLVEPRGRIRIERRKGERLCRTCGDLRRAAGGIDPPADLIGIWHDCDRKGQSLRWRNARGRWLESQGIQATS